MAGRTVNLTAAKGGINRLRIKGGASPDTLYDLENGYVDASGVMRSRPGVPNVVTLPAGTKGLCAYAGKLIVFATSAKTIPASTPTVECEIIVHPETPALDLHEIHFAGPILGFLYVVAEFSDGSVWHYWLERWGAWEANKHYLEGAVVEPTVANGYAYRVYRTDTPNPTWAPSTEYTLGSVVEPTEANGFKYTAIEAIGSPARSGATEPAWPETEGAIVTEEAETSASGTTVTTTNPATALPPDVTDRYGNGIWSELIGRAL